MSEPALETVARPTAEGAGEDELRRLRLLALLLLTAIFAAGLVVPPAVATGALYIVPVLISLWAARPRVTLAIAVSATGLLALGSAAQLALHGGAVLVPAALNASVSVFAVWATARLGLWRMEVERDLEASRRRNATTLEGLAEGVVTTDADGRVVLMNPAAERATGWSARVARGLPLEEVLQLEEEPAGEGRAEAGTTLVARGGRRTPVDATTRPLGGADAAPTERPGATVTIFRDATERRRYEAAIRALAYRDELTGLPNRTSFLDRLQLELAHARRDQARLALLFLDLDGFKQVNDTLGHAAGDALLVGVAERLTATLRDGDTVARLGGDEFTLILPGVSAAADADAVADKIAETLRCPFAIDGTLVPVGTSIGRALYPQDGETPDALLRHADAAMYRAKSSGRRGGRPRPGHAPDAGGGERPRALRRPDPKPEESRP